MDALIANARFHFHKRLFETNTLTLTTAGVASNADTSSRGSKAIARRIVDILVEEQHHAVSTVDKISGQTLGKQFETLTMEFLRETFPYLQNLRPGNWTILQLGNNNKLKTSDFAQYEHLAYLNALTTQNAQLAAALGNDYLVAPDVVVYRDLYEDSEMVVFSKPPFMPCHPSIKHRDDTLGNLFAALYPSLAFRPVNRLDRNTSGCVLVAKSQRSAAMLQKSFEKTYVGIIKDLPHCGGRICAPIAREQETIIKRCVRADGQYSATDYLVRKRLGDLSLVDFFLETGRTHQIRVHSAFMGYPLLGDDLYGEASPLISRQALHCEKMTFQSPENGRIVTVTAPLPEDMLCLMTPDR